MITITPLQPDQVAEAKRMIYTVAHQLFNASGTLEATIARYQTSWPLRDVDDYQRGYLENGGVFLVMRDDGRIIGTGALRRLVEGEGALARVGEIKRLWLLPAYQGQGLGYRMMLELLAAARERGYETLRLETSPAYQERAFAFYQKLGFREIPRYGDDPDDVGMELNLAKSDIS